MDEHLKRLVEVTPQLRLSPDHTVETPTDLAKLLASGELSDAVRAAVLERLRDEDLEPWLRRNAYDGAAREAAELRRRLREASAADGGLLDEAQALTELRRILFSARKTESPAAPAQPVAPPPRPRIPQLPRPVPQQPPSTVTAAAVRARAPLPDSVKAITAAVGRATAIDPRKSRMMLATLLGYAAWISPLSAFYVSHHISMNGFFPDILMRNAVTLATQFVHAHFTAEGLGLIVAIVIISIAGGEFGKRLIASEARWFGWLTFAYQCVLANRLFAYDHHPTPEGFTVAATIWFVGVTTLFAIAVQKMCGLLAQGAGERPGPVPWRAIIGICAIAGLLPIGLTFLATAFLRAL